MCVAQAADVFGTGVVAGAFVIGSVAIHPAAARLGASAHVLLRRELIRLARWMPPFMFLPVFASIAAMTAFLVLDTLGLALSLATIGITIAINAPLNRRFALWSPEALPEDWQTYVDPWNTAHSARTTTAFVAFVCAILARS